MPYTLESMTRQSLNLLAEVLSRKPSEIDVLKPEEADGHAAQLLPSSPPSL